MDSRVAAVHDVNIYAQTEQGVNKGEYAVTEVGGVACSSRWPSRCRNNKHRSLLGYKLHMCSTATVFFQII